MRIFNFMTKRIFLLLIWLVISAFLNNCGIYKPTDARKVSPNVNERVKKNLEEGKGFSIGKSMRGGEKGTTYQFASSNPMWRASLDILDFLPLANVD